MRRLLALALLLVVAGAVVASAAFLGVDGGVLQVFEPELNLDLPEKPVCGETDDCADRSQASELPPDMAQGVEGREEGEEDAESRPATSTMPADGGGTTPPSTDEAASPSTTHQNTTTDTRESVTTVTEADETSDDQ